MENGRNTKPTPEGLTSDGKVDFSCKTWVSENPANSNLCSGSDIIYKDKGEKIEISYKYITLARCNLPNYYLIN